MSNGYGDNMPVVKSDENGNLVLHDPNALGVIKAVEKHNCKATLEMNAEPTDCFGVLDVGP